MAKVRGDMSRRHTGNVAPKSEPPASPGQSRWQFVLTHRQDALVSLILLLAVLIAYRPAWNGGRIWDDDAHLTRPELRSLGGLWRIWFELGATQQYYPLAHSAFWTEAQLWGDHLLGYHLVNIFLHALSAFLIFVILRRLSAPGALLAGAIFALHPIEVESVAWMSELKNALSGVFYFAGLLVYLTFDRTRRAKPYLVAALFLVCALLSKSVTATLPLGLLVIFWWKRGTLSWRRDVAPLIPFIAVAVISGAFTSWDERSLIGAQGSEFHFSLIERFLIAGHSFLFYLGRLFWPADLIFIYPRWKIDAAVWGQYLYPCAAAALILIAWAVRTRTRAPLAALLYYGITLGPALGFVNVYPFRFSFVADHFQYLAGVGVIALIAASIDWLLCRLKTPSPVLRRTAAALTLGLILGVLTWRQSSLYAGPRVLYEETLRRNPSAWLAHLNLGYMADQDPSQGKTVAMAHYRAALAIDPDEAQVHKNLGTDYMELGHYDDALKEYQAAVRSAPGYHEAYLNMGTDLQDMGRYQEAEAAFREALVIKAEDAVAHYDLGVALTYLNRRDEAAFQVKEALRIQPDYADALRLQRDLASGAASGQPAGPIARSPEAETHAKLGEDLVHSGKLEESVAEFKEALRIEPDAAEVRGMYGFVLWQMGRAQEAERELRQASRALPRDPAIHANLGNALQALGRLDEAVAEYTTALQFDAGPSRAEVLNGLGVAYAKVGRMEEAVAQFREAVRLNPSLSSAQANLAKALGRG
ncbi:MAG: tetratricopeptide repeat protein, partial [Acidobacteriota bacterium]|nr:tetratricopeptide repeat protein [Acidobacteriota bacterium]